MWQHVGLFRNRAGLQSALDRLEPAWRAMDRDRQHGGSLDAEGWRAASLLTVGRLIARAALRREESRGGHYRAGLSRTRRYTLETPHQRVALTPRSSADEV